MIARIEKSVGYLFEMEKKHANHAAMGPRGHGTSASIKPPHGFVGNTGVVSGDKPVKVPTLQPDATGKVPVPKKVAEAGAKLAMETLRTDRNWEGAMSQRQDIQWGQEKERMGETTTRVDCERKQYKKIGRG